jgi:hypothetical protein
MDTNNTLLGMIDADDRDALVSRRAAILRGAKTSAFVKLALASASVPVGLAALSSEVYGQAPAATVTAVLQFALLLENLESEFYKTVLNENAAGQPAITATTNPQAAAFQPVRTAIAALPNATQVLATLRLIRDHEVAHVNLLRTALGANAGAVMTGANFDFTGTRNPTTSNGPFLPATNNVDFLLAAAQGFEDTGVRAYKGQAPNLVRTATLQTALQIHSMEARHAAQLRRIRRSRSASTDVLRLSGTVRGAGAAAAGAPSGLAAAVTDAFAKIYAGEDVSTQAGFNAANVTGTGAGGGFGANAAGEAFDEALSRADVVAIVQPFVVAAIPAT